jgi:hypothetical protein
MWTQFWQTSQQAANAWRTSPPRAAAPVRSLIQQSQPVPQPSAAPPAQVGVPSIDVSRAALATPFTAAAQSSRRVALSARSAAAPPSFRSAHNSSRSNRSQQVPTRPIALFLLSYLSPSRIHMPIRSQLSCSSWVGRAAARARRCSGRPPPPPPPAGAVPPPPPPPLLPHPVCCSPNLRRFFCSALGYKRRTAGR